MRRFLFAAAALLSVSQFFFQTEAIASTQPQVGKVNFPTGCLPSVQQKMETGLAFLHSFQYEEAEAAFTSAANGDPNCALAYWGKAMSLYEPLWDFPKPQTLSLGRQYLAQAQKVLKSDARVSEYIGAATAFFQPGNIKPLARLQSYSAAMQKLYRDHPEDNEAGEIYALSLISLAQMGVDDLSHRKNAIAILNPIFAKYPQNPGAAHYLIHATDVPQLAPEGLSAARAYAKIAPDSAHALHMPSHIFRRLGMWQEVIDSNLASAASAEKASKAHHAAADYQFHAMDFLNYAYLQSGRESKAKELVPALQNVPNASETDIIDAQNRFAARNALELHRWKEAATLELPKEQLIWQDYTWWARAIGSARSHDVQGARTAVQKLLEIAQIVKSSQLQHKNCGNVGSLEMSIDPSEAAGWLAFAEGQSEKAVSILQSAATREEARDSEPFATPAREMLADLYLELGKSSEALAEYKQSLKNYPNRFNSLFGAARAAEATGDARAAKEFYAKLIANCPANADRPELETARKYIAGHPKP